MSAAHSVCSLPHRLQSCLIWNLGSFGKLAIRTILWEYVYVSLVFLQINSKGRGQTDIFHSTAAALLRLGTGVGMATAALSHPLPPGTVFN